MNATPVTELPGSGRVLTWSTIAFTVMFAVWLMFGILGVPIKQEFGLTNAQLTWISSLAVLNGSMWRLPAGMLADRIGGRKVMLGLLLIGAAASLAVSYAQNYPMLLVLAFLVGFVGNGFSVGVSWNSAWFSQHRKGFALGLFGAGNVGASVTKFIGPAIIAATAGSTYFLGIRGGWRLIPVIYAVLLLVLAVCVLLFTPAKDRIPGEAKPIKQMLRPLRDVRVWRFSLYYVVVFGAYVALSAYLPNYYVTVFGLDLQTAALLTATFIFPASLLRPLGGWVSDRWGARRAMYATFFVMLLTSGILMMPNGHLVVAMPDGSERTFLPYQMNLWLFVALVFLMGCAMGIGKAAVYKHIPTYFPDNVGSVGGLVGMLGGLGGFFLPLMFSYGQQATGMWSSAFVVLFGFVLVSLLWMHWTIHRMLHDQSPQLEDVIDRPDAGSDLLVTT
ncbi:NarK/NasA family nitrate transporter [Tessaracoccus sp. SD287]|uniref:MFS transporter n=1 Tax=Tessaracoccus sp. SD287 TaxID=2782008 RepID=UPI001A962C21|nr:nitrate/nitrite transporter [Tessaracoccus sp. SD287]MBO1030447.1 NarK/NasA family nitrate transporter [Tessaracoccus sp. SD287]